MTEPGWVPPGVETRQRTRPGHRPRHQHLRCALIMEIAISETHARDRAAEAAFVLLVEIKAGLERNAPDRRADGLAADLKRIAGKPQMAYRAGARELHRASRAIVVEDAARAAGAVETGEGEHFAGYEPAGLIGGHLSGQGGRNYRSCGQGSQHETRKHAITPTY